MSIRTPIARIRGLGSARDGVGRWLMLRITAVGTAILGIWFVFAAISLSGATYEEAIAWLSSPLTASLMVLLVVASFYHACLGVREVIEDYVHGEGAKVASIIALNLFGFAVGTICIVSILKVAIGG